MIDTLEVTDFKDSKLISNINDLESVLRNKYYKNSNCFYITSENETTPMLNILSKDGKAVVHYFDRERFPGYISLNKLVKNKSTVNFYQNIEGEVIDLSSNYVISLYLAIVAAKEFYKFRCLPKSLEWQEL